MLNSEYLFDLAQKTSETIQEYGNSNTGWTVVKNKNDILIERKPSKCEGFSHGYLYRGQCEYICPKGIIYQYIDAKSGDSLRMKWDTDMKSVETLQTVSPNIRIVRTYTNSAAMGLITPRDFTDLLAVTQRDDMLANAGVSLESGEWPPVPDFVRGWNHPCGFMCQDVIGKSDTTRLTTFIQTDIRGSLPSSLVQSAIPSSMVGFFTNLKKILKKDGHISK